MKIDELHEQLKVPYSASRGYGITKLSLSDPAWDNIYFVVPPPPRRELNEEISIELLSESLRTINRLHHPKEMNDLDRLVNYLFIRREVVQSSRLEGTWSTIDHVLTPGELFEKNEAKNEHQAVRSYATLIEEMIEQTLQVKEEVFNIDNICHIHKRIIENDPNSKGVPGKIRTEGEPGAIVTIGGGLRKENSIFNPPPASHVKSCLNDILVWLRDVDLAQKGDASLGGLSLPIRLALGHAHFEAVHPFTDGNGRVGRALWPLQMVCAGHMPLYLSGYVEKYKSEYVHALEQAQKKLSYKSLIEYICRAIIESDIENRKTKSAIESLEDKWQERAAFRAKSGPRKALQFLLTTPIIDSTLLKEKLSLSKTASVDTIKALEQKKIISYRKTENRKRIYAAEELIHILSRPFGSDIELALEKAHIHLGLK